MRPPTHHSCLPPRVRARSDIERMWLIALATVAVSHGNGGSPCTNGVHDAEHAEFAPRARVADARREERAARAADVRAARAHEAADRGGARVAERALVLENGAARRDERGERAWYGEGAAEDVRSH